MPGAVRRAREGIKMNKTLFLLFRIHGLVGSICIHIYDFMFYPLLFTHSTPSFS